jgi:hypothetical protein
MTSKIVILSNPQFAHPLVIILNSESGFGLFFISSLILDMRPILGDGFPNTFYFL